MTRWDLSLKLGVQTRSDGGILWVEPPFREFGKI